MTQREILDHPRYFDGDYTFPGEQWDALNVDGYDKYQQSNYYRVKRTVTNKIMKPQDKYRYRHFVFGLYNNDGKSKEIKAERLFPDFDLKTRADFYMRSEFIAGAF